MKGKKILGSIAVASVASVSLAACGNESATYTVTFVNGTETIATYNVADGGFTQIPANPTAPSGYYFAGWDANGDNTVDTIGAITGNVTYSAVFLPFGIHTVTFQDESGATVGVVSYEEGATSVVEPAVPAKEGYSGSWGSYTLSGDVVVKPVYEPIEYTVTFVADGEVIASPVYTVENKQITVPEVPAKADYTGVWEAYELTTGDIVVNAVYTRNAYTLAELAGEYRVGEEVLVVSFDSVTITYYNDTYDRYSTTTYLAQGAEGAEEYYTIDGNALNLRSYTGEVQFSYEIVNGNLVFISTKSEISGYGTYKYTVEGGATHTLTINGTSVVYSDGTNSYSSYFATQDGSIVVSAGDSPITFSYNSNNNYSAVIGGQEVELKKDISSWYGTYYYAVRQQTIVINDTTANQIQLTESGFSYNYDDYSVNEAGNLVLTDYWGNEMEFVKLTASTIPAAVYGTYRSEFGEELVISAEGVSLDGEAVEYTFALDSANSSYLTIVGSYTTTYTVADGVIGGYRFYSAYAGNVDEFNTTLPAALTALAGVYSTASGDLLVVSSDSFIYRNEDYVESSYYVVSEDGKVHLFKNAGYILADEVVISVVDGKVVLDDAELTSYNVSLAGLVGSYVHEDDVIVVSAESISYNGTSYPVDSVVVSGFDITLAEGVALSYDVDSHSLYAGNVEYTYSETLTNDIPTSLYGEYYNLLIDETGIYLGSNQDVCTIIVEANEDEGLPGTTITLDDSGNVTAAVITVSYDMYGWPATQVLTYNAETKTFVDGYDNSHPLLPEQIVPEAWYGSYAASVESWGDVYDYAITITEDSISYSMTSWGYTETYDDVVILSNTSFICNGYTFTYNPATPESEGVEAKPAYFHADNGYGDEFDVPYKGVVEVIVPTVTSELFGTNWYDIYGLYTLSIASDGKISFTMAGVKYENYVVLNDYTFTIQISAGNLLECSYDAEQDAITVTGSSLEVNLFEDVSDANPQEPIQTVDIDFSLCSTAWSYESEFDSFEVAIYPDGSVEFTGNDSTYVGYVASPTTFVCISGRNTWSFEYDADKNVFNMTDYLGNKFELTQVNNPDVVATLSSELRGTTWTYSVSTEDYEESYGVAILANGDILFSSNNSDVFKCLAVSENSFRYAGRAGSWSFEYNGTAIVMTDSQNHSYTLESNNGAPIGVVDYSYVGTTWSYSDGSDSYGLAIVNGSILLSTQNMDVIECVAVAGGYYVASTRAGNYTIANNGDSFLLTDTMGHVFELVNANGGSVGSISADLYNTTWSYTDELDNVSTITVLSNGTVIYAPNDLDGVQCVVLTESQFIYATRFGVSSFTYDGESIVMSGDITFTKNETAPAVVVDASLRGTTYSYSDDYSSYGLSILANGQVYFTSEGVDVVECSAVSGQYFVIDGLSGVYTFQYNGEDVIMVDPMGNSFTLVNANGGSVASISQDLFNTTWTYSQTAEDGSYTDEYHLTILSNGTVIYVPNDLDAVQCLVLSESQFVYATGRGLTMFTYDGTSIVMNEVGSLAGNITLTKDDSAPVVVVDASLRGTTYSYSDEYSSYGLSILANGQAYFTSEGVDVVECSAVSGQYFVIDGLSGVYTFQYNGEGFVMTDPMGKSLTLASANGGSVSVVDSTLFNTSWTYSGDYDSYGLTILASGQVYFTSQGLDVFECLVLSETQFVYATGRGLTMFTYDGTSIVMNEVGSLAGDITFTKSEKLNSVASISADLYNTTWSYTDELDNVSTITVLSNGTVIYAPNDLDAGQCLVLSETQFIYVTRFGVYSFTYDASGDTPVITLANGENPLTFAKNETAPAVVVDASLRGTTYSYSDDYSSYGLSILANGQVYFTSEGVDVLECSVVSGQYFVIDGLSGVYTFQYNGEDVIMVDPMGNSFTLVNANGGSVSVVDSTLFNTSWTYSQTSEDGWTDSYGLYITYDGKIYFSSQGVDVFECLVLSESQFVYSSRFGVYTFTYDGTSIVMNEVGSLAGDITLTKSETVGSIATIAESLKDTSWTYTDANENVQTISISAEGVVSYTGDSGEAVECIVLGESNFIYAGRAGSYVFAVDPDTGNIVMSSAGYSFSFTKVVADSGSDTTTDGTDTGADADVTA